MQKPAQQIVGAVQITGPQPVTNPGAVQSAIDSSSTLGSVNDMAATNPGGGSVNAKLGALMLCLYETNELLARVVELLEQQVDPPQ